MARSKSTTDTENTDTETAEVTVDPVAAARAATSTANREAIDFSAGKSAHDLASEKAVVTSRWVSRLDDLAAGVDAGQGEVDVFYRIGTFSTKTGARTALNSVAKRPLSREFLLETRIVGPVESRTSELWAAVPAPEANAA